MANISDGAQAFGVGIAVDNQPLTTAARIMPRKMLIIATATNSAALFDKPVRVLSADDAGAKFGLGSTAHRLAVAAWRGHGGACKSGGFYVYKWLYRPEKRGLCVHQR